MKQNSCTIRISTVTKYLIDHDVRQAYKEAYPNQENVTISDIVTHLTRNDMGISYDKLRSKAEDKLANGKR